MPVILFAPAPLPPEGGEVVVLSDGPWRLTVTRRDGAFALDVAHKGPRAYCDAPKNQDWTKSFPLTEAEATAFVAEPARAKPLPSPIYQLRREEWVLGAPMHAPALEIIAEAAFGPAPPSATVRQPLHPDHERLSLDPWGLIVERRGEAFVLNMNVESGFTNWERSFPLSRDQAETFASDPARRAALQDVLHPLLQVEPRKPPPPGLLERIVATAASTPLDGLDARLRALVPDARAALAPPPASTVVRPPAQPDRERVCTEPWICTVERRGDTFALIVHVAMGQGWRDRPFPVSRVVAEALAADRTRRMAMYDVLHPLLQRERTEPLPPGLAQRIIETAATAPLVDLDATLRALAPERRSGPALPAETGHGVADVDHEQPCLDPWRLAIERRGDAHVLAVHVESGHMDWERPFQVTRAQAEALAAEPPRRFALLDALHPLLQCERRKPMPPGLAERLIDTAAHAPLGGLDARLEALVRAGDDERATLWPLTDAEARKAAGPLMAGIEEFTRWVESWVRIARWLPGGTAEPAPQPKPSRSRRAVDEEIRLDMEWGAHEPSMRAIGAEPVTVHRDPRGPDWGVTREYRWRDRLIRVDHDFDRRFAVRVTAGPTTPDGRPDAKGWLPLECLVEPEAHPPVLGKPGELTDAETFERRIAMLPGADLSFDPAALPWDDFWRRD